MIQDSLPNRPTIPKRCVVLLAAGVGVLLGIGISTAGLKANWLKAFSVLSITAGLSSATTYFVLDYRYISQRRLLQQQIDRLTHTTTQLQRERDRATAESAQLQQEIQTAKSTIEQITAESTTTQAFLQWDLDRAIGAYQEAMETHDLHLATLQHQQNEIDRFQQERADLLARLHDLLQSMEEEIAQQVEQQTAHKLQILRRSEIKQIAAEYETLATQLFGLFERFEHWGAQTKEGHEAKATVIRGLATEYNSTIDQLKQSVSGETSSYIAQIELLNEKLARAYAENRGEILAVQKRDFGYAPEGKIVNAIAHWIAEDLGIPLAVNSYYLRSDGAIEAGYSYSRSANPIELVKRIQAYAPDLRRRLQIHEIASIRKLEITDCIAITVRLQSKAIGSKLDDLVGSRGEFEKFISEQPCRIRLIGDMGAGKTPLKAWLVTRYLESGVLMGNKPGARKVRNVLATVAYPNAATSVTDSEDYPLFPLLRYPTMAECKTSFSDAKAEYTYRAKNKDYADRFFHIWVWDELDNTLAACSGDESSHLKTLLNDGGHRNLGVIVSGQSVMTRDLSGFTDDDRSKFLEIILEPHKIRRYLERYGRTIFGEQKTAQLKSTLAEIEPLIEEKNDLIVDEAKRYRLALVAHKKSPRFFWLPVFGSVVIDADRYAEVQAAADEAKRTGHSPKALQEEALSHLPARTAADSATPAERSLKLLSNKASAELAEIPLCPRCGSVASKRNGKGRGKYTGTQKFKCLACGKEHYASRLLP